MIWLSPTADDNEQCFYFDIRAISVRGAGLLSEGLIQGVLGDGQQELWTEVVLGRQPKVNILPVWTDQGTVEGFEQQGDEADLKARLLDAIDDCFGKAAQMTCAGPAAHFGGRRNHHHDQAGRYRSAS